MTTTILPASGSHQPIIAEMLQAYALDLLEYIDIPHNEEGQFEYPDFDSYWRDPEDYFPFLISTDGEIAGFIFVNRCHNLVDPTAWSIEDFYVAPAYRRKGVGFQAACQALSMFTGNWEVAIITRNSPAIAFWDAVIAQTVAGTVSKHDWNRDDLSFQVFTFTTSLSNDLSAADA